MKIEDVQHLVNLVDVYNIYEFFAKCDGFLWKQQQQALEDYKIKLELSNIESILFDKMSQIEFRRLDQVILATKSILDSVGERKNDVLSKVNDGISYIINANGEVSADESAFYNEWKRVFGLM